MADKMSRIEQFEKEMKDIDYYITSPTSFLYDKIEDPNIQEIVECTRSIAINNYFYILDKKEEIERLQKQIASAQPVTEQIEEPKPKQEEPSTEITSVQTKRDLKDIIELVIYSLLDDDAKRVLETLTQEEYKQVKLQIYRLILATKLEIRDTIRTNPTANILSLQDNLNSYEIILDVLNEHEIKKEEEQQELLGTSNIIVAPNKKNSTYLYEDIENYPERYKEIKLIYEKIIDGYFLRTKDTKPIEGYQENLYEYKHPNGIRILYVVEHGLIIICSLFMKDKQKSTRISNEYDEAINRYYEVKDYILENYNTTDFYIEQAELVGEIFQILDGISLTKKVGE